ncbi:MAG: phage baseplate assembly protein V, partial [Cyclobacteriaceae bacterium]
ETVMQASYTVSNWSVNDQELLQNTDDVQDLDESGESVRNDGFINIPGDLSVNESRAYAENQLERNRLARMISTAKVMGTTEVSPGDTISLKGLTASWKNESFVSAIRHVVVKGTWYTYIQCGLTDKSHAEIYRISQKPQQNLLSTIDGLHYGKVVGYKTSEGGHELIEVVLPTGNENEKNQTVYARLATLSAGSQGGSVFRPYPDDEVVIGFIGNDPRFPVILGSLFNSQNEPPFGLTNDEQKKTGISINDWQIVTDEENNTLSVASPNGQMVMIDDGNNTISMIHDDRNGITISAKGITMEASRITLKGTNGIALEGSKIHGKANTDMTLESGLSLSLEGKVAAKLKGQITQIN